MEPLRRGFAKQGEKGKQVQNLYDLVTVNRRATLQDAIAKVRRRGAVMTRKSGNLPATGTGQRPGHEELAVPNTAAFAAGLGYAMRPFPERSPFRIPTVGVPFFVGLTDDTLGRILFINFFCAKDTRRKKQ